MDRLREPQPEPLTPSGDRTEGFDVATVTTPEVACAGDHPPDDHPLIYMTFGPERVVTCPYCSRRFCLDDAVPPGPLAH